MYRVWLFFLAAVGGSCVYAEQNITVIRMRLDFEQEHRLTVDHTVEYILQFRPSQSDAEFPSRVWVSSLAGDLSRPVLITYRQRAGAGTWQLPYESGDTLQHEFERTLCPDDAASYNQSSYCEDAEVQQEARGEFSLHVVSACARGAALRLRVSAARDWRLHYERAQHVFITLTAPRVHHYRFADEKNVRLVISSTDDVCAIIAVQNITCPIGDMLNDVQSWSQRMTVQRSGAVQLSRANYPHGFYIVALVQNTDSPCTGETEESQDWLWQEILGDFHVARNPLPRIKALDLEIKPSLTISQYVLATAVTTALFLGFYVAFFLLVLAQRWSPFAKMVRPRAVLASDIQNGGQTEVDGGPRQRQRRDSTATFDSSDMSDSDEEPTPVTRTTNASPTTPASPASPTAAVPPSITPASPGTPESRDTVDGPALNGATTQENGRETQAEEPVRPFGLPARLRLAALARRRGRVVAARSDRYLHTLYTVAVFYALPVIQFVTAFQVFLNVSGSLDTCYYNFLCAHPAGDLSDFNHVFSNTGYLLLGALFLLQVRRRRNTRKLQPRHEDYGIPAHYGLLEALGVGMMVVALLSASYHVCPNRLNFQFDTAFMYVLAVLSMVKIYQSRHPDVNARAHATFGVLAVLIALVVWGVLGGGPLFWGLFTVLHIFGFLLLSLRIYYLGQFRFEKQSLQTAALQLSRPPLYTPRLVALLVANALNWAFALYGLFTQDGDFAGHLLTLLLGNTLLHLMYYLAMKLFNGERPRWYAWCYVAGASAAWAPALYFFLAGSTDWSATPAQSRHLNHECRVLRFYDSHDLWHFLSAIALYLTFNVFLTWDDGLTAVKRTDIAVF
ncbi:SID1 transmembrane family member 1 [Amyelois transitella]|uniref:SID1 transmembrane family member 1 n=1 Tax=Amyelois transitella TaxID=680683 RepID=UPI00067CA163|nr:SID1 transmembrane family member 1 [Amyelois transitella]